MGTVLSLVWNTEFAAVVHEHAPTMRVRLRKLGLFAADVEDCLQDAFVKAWQLHEQMPSEPEKLRQWLGRIAFHASSRRRRELKRTIYLEPFDEFASLAGQSRSNTEAPAMLAEMLEGLPERYHEIVRLHLEGHSIDDIAKRYGIPWTTAKSRWDRACVLMGGT